MTCVMTCQTGHAARFAVFEDVRPQINQALAQIASPDEEPRAGGCVMLAQLGSSARDALPFVLKALDDPRPAVKASCLGAASSIASLNDQPVGEFIAALQSADSQIRDAGVFALHKINPTPPSAISPLIAYLDRETAATLKHDGSWVGNGYAVASEILKEVHTPEADAALKRSAEAVMDRFKTTQAQNQLKMNQYQAERAEDAKTENQLKNLPWTALKLILAVLLISGLIRLWRYWRG
jgi:hypothetical protein